MDDVSDIRAYYDASLVEEERLTRHPLEEEITWLYLERYLPSEGSVLEVGAATGRYTRELARRGYRVTAVDLSPVLGEENQRR
jgi:2-polyprenyl-3-methyl-5-hydroxy-6-metoxy-1,4-benzoquinol methylase